jgi:hypothetical protein
MYLNQQLWGDISPHNDISRQEIINNVQQILNSTFSNKYKTTIHEFQERLNFACPYCGDSTKDEAKVRGNLYFSTQQYHCFNCGKHTSIFNFFKKFLPSVSIKYDQYNKYTTTNINVIHKKNEFNILDSDFIKKYAIPKYILLKNMNWQNIENSKGEYYINFRLIKDNNKSKFAYDSKYNAIIILNIDDEENVIGLQIRPIVRSKGKSNFFTYNLSKLYTKIYPDIYLKSKEEVIIIDAISTVFGILQVNFSDTITIFEGPFDALMFKNSIATAGALKHLPFSAENIRYWYDNDKTGIKKSFECLESGKLVFMWSKYWEDLGFELNIKDLNELMIYCKKNNINILDFNKYFSNDKIDAIYV